MFAFRLVTAIMTAGVIVIMVEALTPMTADAES